MFTAQILTQISGQLGASYSLTQTASAALRKSLIEVIPAGGTVEINFALDASETKLLCMSATGALTVATNNSVTPANGFLVEPDAPFQWAETFPLPLQDSSASALVDVTSLFVTNAGDADQTLTLDALVDPTP